MLKNEQAMDAFEELLKAVETSDARSEALFELLQKQSPVNEQNLKGAMIGATHKKKAHWASLRAKLETILREQPDI
jgi:hypothetical protein